MGAFLCRERQWIINIQLQQLKCENPFIDDYYYTVYNQKKQMGGDGHVGGDEDEEEEEQLQLKRDEEGPQLLLKAESGEGSRELEYTPTQFVNSLGKLQAVTVKAPRKIIDVAVVNNELLGDIGSNQAQKDSR